MNHTEHNARAADRNLSSDGQLRAARAEADAQPQAAAQTLDAMALGRPCMLAGLRAGGRLGQRLADMGFCPGLRAVVVRRAPLGDPLEVDLAGTRVCIRAAEAAEVLVLPLDHAAPGIAAASGREARP